MPDVTTTKTRRPRAFAGGAAKITPLEALASIVARAKATGKRIVQCHGVFDLLHPGHVRHLEAARREGDLLVVTVTSDEFVNKGPGRPVFNQCLRAESLAAMACVDYVAINTWPTAVEAIRLLRPDVYVKGKEYAVAEQDITGKMTEEAQAVQAVGGRLHFTDDITFSSSQLINTHFAMFPPDTEAWLRAFRTRHSSDEVLAHLDGASRLKVLVVGEAIVDEYVFCDGLGKSTKDPILAFRYRSEEAYAGGSLAVANHLAGFCQDVGLVTFLGEAERREEFIRQRLLPGIALHAITRQGAPTIHKRRFVDLHTGARMFELYVMDDDPMSAGDEGVLLGTLRKTLAQYDLVVVADYGHGMLTAPTIGAITDQARFLAVNTQANAGNRGFNTISRYPRADYVCLTGHEIALETRMRHADWKDLVLEVTKRIRCSRFTMTRGRLGSLHYEVGQGFVEAPALATKVTDLVGAGDAVLAITSLLVAKGDVPWEVIGFVGNVAGAQMVAELGNRIAISRVPMAKHIISLLK